MMVAIVSTLRGWAGSGLRETLMYAALASGRVAAYLSVSISADDDQIVSSQLPHCSDPPSGPSVDIVDRPQVAAASAEPPLAAPSAAPSAAAWAFSP